MIIEDNHIDRIIARFVVDEASQEDIQLLGEWMDLSAENKRYVENIRLLHDKALASQSSIKVDTAKAWEKVNAQLDQPMQAITPSKSKRLVMKSKSWVRVAAMFTLVVGISSLFYYLSNSSDSNLIHYNLTAADTSVNKTIAGNIQVYLNKNTTIEVVEDKKNKTRVLQLSGEANFEVKHSDKMQLIVKAGETLIKDIGTTFNVKANADDSTIEVFVEAGEVSFFTNSQVGVRLTKGETGIYDKQTKLFKLNKTDNPNITSYKTHKFVFTNTPLSEVVKAINAVYPNDILLGDSLIGKQTLNVTFDNEDIDAMAYIMSETLGLSLSKTDKGYILNRQ